MAEDAGTTAQRIRIGLTGLAFAFLLVLLGSAISRSGTEPVVNTSQESDNESGPTEPLAELGVAPGKADNPDNVSENR
jgi:hypothetical protein